MMKQRLTAIVMMLATSFAVGLFQEVRAEQSPENLLCSPSGLAKLVPQFRVDETGQLIVPDPTTDLMGFLSAQQGLSNVITAILARQNATLDNPARLAPAAASMNFGNFWLASEIGIKTAGKVISPVDKNFASYRGESFLTGLEPVSLSQGIYYAVKKDSGSTRYPALVYPFPTINPCVNGLVLAAGDTTGSWPQPTYALGKYRLGANGLPDPTQPLDAYLIVNICLDLGSSVRVSSGQVLTPLAQIVTAMHWSCDRNSTSAYCQPTGKAHRH